MPSRFPLVPVPLTNDPFCEDGYCGELPTISVKVSPGAVEEGGGIPFLYTFELSDSLDHPTVISYSMGGTATNGTDYSGSPPSGTVTIPAGSLVAGLTITTLPDGVTEPAETVIVTINSAISDNIALRATDDSATGTILDALAFDTTQYNYARFIGTKTGRYYDAGGGPFSSGSGGQILNKTESNSDWLFIGNSSADGCFLTNRFSEITPTMFPKNPSDANTTPEGNHKWVANYNSWSTVYFNSNFGVGATESGTYWFRNGVFQNAFDGVSPSTADLQPVEMYIKVQGKWQFKYATSQPSISAPADAEWIGNQNVDWTNPDSTFSTPVTIPPYYNS